MTNYNYETFPEDADQKTFEAFADFTKVGAQAPDGELIDAGSSEKTRLSDYWRKGPLVIEFGSIT